MACIYYNYIRLTIDALELFKLKSVKLGDPKDFNDPFDGQLDLNGALEEELGYASSSNMHYEDYLKKMSSKIDVNSIVEETKK